MFCQGGAGVLLLCVFIVQNLSSHFLQLFPYFPRGIFQLHSVPGHFSPIPAASCGCSLWMCSCLQVGRVIPTETGKSLQFCQLFLFEGAVSPIPAETLGNPGSHWEVALHGDPSFLPEQNLALLCCWNRDLEMSDPPGHRGVRVSENRSAVGQKEILTSDIEWDPHWSSSK